ncbi:MAG: rhodoquinone biosynthesis methyltransferase RquA [Alphaproteobacteria bacterium]|nr:rhodoquinone biosynthesis methyltransferase RquA [Alphaproteobacteria bacterium]
MNTPPPEYASTIDTVASLPYGEPVAIPDYLEKHYWWAYVRPWAVRIFERQWLINLILWGWYRPLRDAALAALGENVKGRTLQVSCCYGSFTPTLAKYVKDGGGTLDVIDVAPAQLDNLRRKLTKDAPAQLMLRDATDLKLPEGCYDRVILFFLPHELPREARTKAFAEAWRVVKPGGMILIVEFGKPKWWHPLRYIYLPFLAVLEPFAPDIWGHDMTAWLPEAWQKYSIRQESLFGGYYQKILVTRSA